MSVRLYANPRETAPPLKVCRIPFVPVCRFCVLPVAFFFSSLSSAFGSSIQKKKGIVSHNRNNDYLSKEQEASLSVSQGYCTQARRQSPSLPSNHDSQSVACDNPIIARYPSPLGRRGEIITFKPIALPQLARSDALKSAGLYVGSASHGTAMDLINDAILRNCRQKEISTTVTEL